MGGHCSKSDYHVEEDQSLDVSRHVVGNGGGLVVPHKHLREKPAFREGNNRVLPIPQKVTLEQSGDDANDNHTYDQNESECELEFSVAFPSFVSLNHNGLTEPYSYPPSKTMPVGGDVVCHSDSLHAGQTINRDSSIGSVVINEDQGYQDEASIQRSLSSVNINTTSKAHGYPGELTSSEYEAFQRFKGLLADKPSSYSEMVNAYAPTESEAFAVCRFLRARNFDVDAVFAMLHKNHACTFWEQARANSFYRSLEEYYHGCPVPVLMTMFPVVFHGLAKNGAQVVYFQPSDANMKALRCICKANWDLLPLIWNRLHHHATERMAYESQSRDSATTTVLAEKMIVVDLQGISSEFLNEEIFGVLKKVGECFPETMNKAFVVNVPMALRAVWSNVKLFMDDRTLPKIGFYPTSSDARNDLLECIPNEELLSTYGGTGPSFAEIMAIRQAEASSAPNSRYFVNLFEQGSSTAAGRKIVDVELGRGEEISSIRIYSQGNNGADFWIESAAEDSIRRKCVKRPAEKSPGDHYACEMETSQLPSSFAVFGKSSAPDESYLVTIHICSKP